MRLPKFEYLVPKTIAEACTMLAKYNGQAKVIAGGTNLLPQMKWRQITPGFIISWSYFKMIFFFTQDASIIILLIVAVRSPVFSITTEGNTSSVSPRGTFSKLTCKAGENFSLSIRSLEISRKKRKRRKKTQLLR